ncbi:hypothetical protein IAT38_002033 [Cryptococcus sp. DSM 104549]
MAPPSPTYTPLADPDASPDPNLSPDPAAADPNRDLALLGPEGAALLGRPGSEYLPAPSIMSRDSTRLSMLGGTPVMGGEHRDSWGSGVGLAGAEAGIAGASAGRRASPTRSQSGLAQHSALGWNNTDNDRLSVSDEDEEQGHITPAVAAIGAGGSGAGALSEKPRWADKSGDGKKRGRKWLWALLALGLLALIALGIGLGVGLTRNKSNKDGSAAADNSNGDADSTSTGANGDKSESATATATSASATASATPTTGTMGSLITMDDGTTFTYENTFGGKWVWDAADPFNNEAQVNSWTPALNQNWTWGKDKAFGVNLGGWLVTEPFIVPGLYEKYATGADGTTAIDEFTLSQNMGSNLTNIMKEHYDTFITEKDFAEIAAAGLNWVRLPIGFWSIETWDGEPYLERVSWEYVLKAIRWCRKYGLRLNLDLHNVPGSENGWNHSGRQGSVNFLKGVMGTANAQRALDYIRTLAQFISQPEYAPVVQMFGFINEPDGNSIGKGPVGSFYREVHDMIREITGVGEGNGAYLGIHDGFLGISSWYDFLPGADRLLLDHHDYMVFQDQQTGTLDELKKLPCQWWGKSTNTTSSTYGPNVAGEWSAAWNDCGQWLNKVGGGQRYDGTFAGYEGKAVGSCDYWNDYTQWNQSTVDAVQHFVLSSMDAFQNYFFWTWKIGNSTNEVKQPNPFWHYRLGLQAGYIPKDPRDAVGICEADGIEVTEFDGSYSNAWVTGGAGAGTIRASDSSQYPWPPASYTNVPSASMSKLPQYTQTATPITMPAETFTKPGSTETISAGDGWFSAVANDRQNYAAISGCTYPDEYSAADLAIPATACGAGITQPTKRAIITQAPRAPRAQPTPPPGRR